MSVKSKPHVKLYVADIADILGAIENLKEFVSSLPAPENDELPSLHYGHAASVSRIRELVGEAMKQADSFHGIPVAQYTQMVGRGKRLESTDVKDSIRSMSWTTDMTEVLRLTGQSSVNESELNNDNMA